MKIFGLVGEKLSHSLSPQIHEIIFNKLNIVGKYNLFCIEKNNLNELINSLKVLGINGVNVTIPYKEDVIKYLDYIAPEVERIGAVNTILIKENKALGYNTDYYGFGEMLKKAGVTIKDKVFYVLGAGGASKSIVHYLKDNNAKKIIVVSRNPEEARKKFSMENFEVIDYKELSNIEHSYGVINTTPCGMYPNVNSSPISNDILKKFSVAMDIVYNPEETLFLKNAKALGLDIVGGLTMLIGQGIKAEELWNNISIDNDIEKEIYNNLRNILNS